METEKGTGTKQKRKRSSTGCIGCRLRRKKCSEEKPHCANCVRNAILCTWPEPGNDKHAELLRRTNPTKGKPKTARPTFRLPSTASTEDCDSIAPRSPSARSVSSRSPSFSTASNSRSDCGDRWSGLDTKLIDTLKLIPRSVDPETLLGSTLLREPRSKRLLHHYLHRTNKVMAGCHGDRNPYVTELIPMAMSDELVLHVLLACSGIHYAGLAGTPVDEVTWMHYGQAIQAQKFGLTQLARGKDDGVVALVVTAVLLCIIETFRVDAGATPLHHLRAARVLLHKALKLPENLLSRDTRAFLIERYTYTITLAHISMGSESDEWVLDDAETLFPMMQVEPPNVPGAISQGGVHELFQLIPKVAVLARQHRAEKERGIAPIETTFKYLSLQHTISSWRPTGKDENHDHDLCGILYQQALVVYMAASFGDQGHESSGYCAPVQEAFDKFMPFLASIPLDAAIATTMCWPLAVFGTCARTLEHQQIIGDKLEALSIEYSSRSVRDTKLLLERIWDENNGWEASPLSLEDIMKKEGTTVLLL
ncbi:Fc.00g017490.m01.CDS01 [Cosmosporella sp. VM-42]